MEWTNLAMRPRKIKFRKYCKSCEMVNRYFLETHQSNCNAETKNDKGLHNFNLTTQPEQNES